MSYTWDYLQANPKEAKRLLGINYEQLTQLIEQGKVLHEQHLIRLVKIFRVAQERFRLHLNKYNSVILTICGLVRLRKGGLVLKVLKSTEVEGKIEVIKQHFFSSLLTATSSISDSTVELGRSSLIGDSQGNLVPEVA